MEQSTFNSSGMPNTTRLFQAVAHNTTGFAPGSVRDYKAQVNTPISARKRVSEINQTNSAVVSNPTTTTDALPAKKPKVTYPVPNQCMDEGHFYVVLGEDVDAGTGRYKILSMLGQGTFGKVVEAWDRQRKEYCAVKIVRNTVKYTRDAQIEVKYMERVCQRDLTGEFAFARISRHFLNNKGHMCIVMPKHGKCLLDVIQKFGPLSTVQVAQVAYQMGRTLDFLHTQNRYIHTDLKPENMLLDQPHTGLHSPTPLKLRICDLGGCSDERHGRTSIVSTRHYRAPEVVLGLGWMFPADMWSLGCILFELAMGRLLYDTHDNLEHLNMMVATLGPLPTFDWAPKVGIEECKPYFHSVSPFSLKPPTKGSSRLSRCAPIETMVRDAELASVIRACLNYDQSQRLTARQLMNHPFVMRHVPESMHCQLNPVPGEPYAGNTL